MDEKIPEDEVESEEPRSRSIERPISESEEESLKSAEGASGNEDGRGASKESAFKRWRSVLLKSGVGPFLQPRRLQEKMHLQMAKYGLL